MRWGVAQTTLSPYTAPPTSSSSVRSGGARARAVEAMWPAGRWSRRGRKPEAVERRHRPRWPRVDARGWPPRRSAVRVRRAACEWAGGGRRAAALRRGARDDRAAGHVREGHEAGVTSRLEYISGFLRRSGRLGSASPPTFRRRARRRRSPPPRAVPPRRRDGGSWRPAETVTEAGHRRLPFRPAPSTRSRPPRSRERARPGRPPCASARASCTRAGTW